MYFVCEFEIVQYIPVIVVCWGLQRMMFGSVRCACVLTLKIMDRFIWFKCTVRALKQIESSWNMMAHGDAREEKWRGNWRMEWVANTLHTTLEHGVSSIITSDAHTSAASSRPNWRPRRFKWTRPFRRTKSGFCTCAITFQLASTFVDGCGKGNIRTVTLQFEGDGYLKSACVQTTWCSLSCILLSAFISSLAATLRLFLLLTLLRLWPGPHN